MLSDQLGTRLHETWAVEALGMLELGLGDARRAAQQFERQQQLLAALQITDPDLSPALACALRCSAVVADDDRFAAHFEHALRQHAGTPDAFEAARTRLAYGERLRRARGRVRARAQLRIAIEIFERLDARPWADRAHGELHATGEPPAPRLPEAGHPLA